MDTPSKPRASVAFSTPKEKKKKKKNERKPFLGACSRTKGIITIFFIYIFSTGYDNNDDDDDNNNNNDNNNNTPMKNGVVYKK